MQLQHDGLLQISVGDNRRQAIFKNIEVHWRDVVKRISRTHRTPETYAQYTALDKQQQDDIKDVGGFIGGWLKDGRRRKEYVLHRQLLTLDVDFACATFWADVLRHYGHCACAIYSTHKHTPQQPRYRLVMPVNRALQPHEYETVCRHIATQLGMHMFDATTFQAGRLMYWPSTSKDAAFVHECNDAPWLNADEILYTADGKRNAVGTRHGVSTMGAGIGNEATVAAEAEKQSNPLEKPGIIGAFCRSYNIHEAIELFLSEVYAPCAIPGRYTYMQGSTVGGLATYGNVFAYSFHGTDAAVGRLCNAFDLVRIHRFGSKDVGLAATLPTHKLPSYNAMMAFAAADVNVKKSKYEVQSTKYKESQEDGKSGSPEEIQEGCKAEEAQRQAITLKSPVSLQSFESNYEESHKESCKPQALSYKGEKSLQPTANSLQPSSTSYFVPRTSYLSPGWLSQLDVDSKGNYKNTINNLVLIMQHDEGLQGCIAYDDFEKRPVALRHFPWRDVSNSSRHLTDMDDANLCHYLEVTYGISTTKLDTALGVVYQRTKFHPVRDYLNAQVWDGTPRLDTLFIDYLGAEDSTYVRTVSRKAMVAAVARVMQPGIKFDNVLTFVSEEGIKKSSLIDKLGRQWFSDTFITVQGKEAFEQLQGVWLVEMAELAGLKQAEIEAVKHYISKREDRYRVAYGRRLENFPRQCVFFGTTNKFDFLRGSSGNRRFWPANCAKRRATKDVFTHLTADEVNQVWAEAVMHYHQGEALYLLPAQEELALQAQKEHSESDERAGIISNYLDTILPADWEQKDVLARRAWLQTARPLTSGATRTRVCAAEIWCEALGGLQKDMGAHNTRFIHEVMRGMHGWAAYKSRTVFGLYGNQRGYYRTGADTTVKETTAN